MDLLICQANWLQQENSINLNYFAYSINNFDLEKLETYEKTIISNQAEEWAKAMKQKMDSLI